MASTVPATSHTSATAGAGAMVDFLVAKAHVSMILTAGAGISDGLVAVEGSHDGTNWAVLRRVAISAGENVTWALTGGAYRYFRTNIEKSVTGGGRVTTTFMEGD